MSIEAMKQALEALKNIVNAVYVNSQQEADAVYKANDAIIALEEALAKQEQGEPVGTAGELFTNSALERLDLRPSTKIYTTPRQRTWVGLTDEERYEIANVPRWSSGAFVEATEAKLKEKNT